MATMKEVSTVVKVLQVRFPKHSLKDLCGLACDVLEAVEDEKAK